MFAEIATGLALIAALIAGLSLCRVRMLSRRLDAVERLLAGQGAASAAGSRATASQAADTPQVIERDPVPDNDAVAGGWGAGRASGRALRGLGGWLRANWIYPVAGAALVMATIYLVQYSIERGLLSAQARIGLALLLGALLIAAGEGIRRRWGDEDGPARLLPSTLSGAGIVALLATVLAAFHLYAMLSQLATLLALAAVALLALALGWAHGPLLAALGVVAGAAAPFLLGEGDAPKDLLYAYFALIALLGLGIDGFKRWGWVSALAVVAPLAGAFMIQAAGAAPTGFAALALVVSLLAMTLPSGALVPCAQGRGLFERGNGARDAAVPVAGLALLLSCGAALFLDGVAPGMAVPALLALIGPVWTARAPALAGHMLIPVLAMPAVILHAGLGAQPEIFYALAVSKAMPIAIVALAALAGVTMLWRSARAEGRAADRWALLAIGYPGGTMVAFELFWSMSTRITASVWSGTAMVLAAGYVAVALWAARRDAGQGLRLGAAAAAAFAMIGLSLMLTLSLAALSLALAVLLAVSAAMDRRFDIPLLGLFQALAALALGWRIVIDPGLSWLLGWEETGGAQDCEVLLSLAAALAAPAVAVWLASGMPRSRVRDWTAIFVETALSGLVPVALMVLIARFLVESVSVHAHLGMQGTVFIALAWVQALRAARFADARALTIVRRGLSLAFSLAAALCLGLVMTVFSPLGGGWLTADTVRGPILVNDLILAYALPGSLLLWVFRRQDARGRWFGASAAGLLVAYWIGSAIRHLWQGGGGMALSRGFAQGELYAYTVALLVAGASALALALHLGRTGLRIVGLGLIAVAAAKAFLIDASGLTGLMRVGAFLGLGISLAGLAWLNAWVIARMTGERDHVSDI